MPPRARTGDEPDLTADQSGGDEATTTAAGDTVTFAVAHPYDQWNHGLADLDPITAAGTEVPAGRVDELLAAAKTADVTIRKVRA